MVTASRQQRALTVVPPTIGLVAGLLLMALWWPLHPPRPHQPNSDLYCNLTVARHLVRGEGFQTDLAYPLSFAHRFARRLPQPLIHRDPGHPLLLTLPVWSANADPVRTLQRVRRLHWLLLGGLAGLGTTALVARRRSPLVVPWLLLLGTHPLLAFAVDWGFAELAAGLLLLGLWLRLPAWRQGRWGVLDGLMAGLLMLTRGDLAWVPVWWGVIALAGSDPGRRRPLLPRRWWLGPVAALLVITPWLTRNLMLTGNPWFSLQAEAELVKMTRTWPEYSVYLQLDPQPALEALAADPLPLLRKAARGLRFFLTNLPRMLPWPLLLAAALALALGRQRLGRFRWLALATLALLVFQYAWFDHSLRHLLPVLPVLYWEGLALVGLGADRCGRWWPGPVRGRWLLPTILTAGVLLAAPLRLPGWDRAVDEARAARGLLAGQLAEAQASDGPFTAWATVPWYLDRPAVWTPADPKVRARILAWLNPPTPGS